MREERRLQTDSAIKIQALRRQVVAKQHVQQRRKEHKDQTEAAIKIQTIGRQKAAKRHVESLRQQKARLLPAGCEEVALIQLLFDAIDPTHSGAVSRGAFMKAVQLDTNVQRIIGENEVLRGLLNPVKLGIKWKEMDINEDDHISIDEMIRFAMSIQEG